MPPVLRLNVPALERVFFQNLETSPLLLSADMQPELDHHVAVVGDGALKIHNVTVALAPLLLRRQTFDSLHQHSAIPTAVENGHLAIVGQFEPKAPQPGHVCFVRARRLDGIQLEAARIEPLRQQVDGGPLASGIPALKNDHAGDVGVPTCFLQIVQPVT